jgi:hypothetical protein
VQVLPLGRHGLQLQRVSVGALLVSCSSLGHWRLGPLLSSPRPCVAAFVSLCSCAPVFDTCWGKRQDAEGEESVHRRNCSTYPGAHGLIRVCLGARAFAVILRDRRGHHSCPREGVFFFFFCKYQMMKTVQSDPLYVPCWGDNNRINARRDWKIIIETKWRGSRLVEIGQRLSRSVDPVLQRDSVPGHSRRGRVDNVTAEIRYDECLPQHIVVN